MSQLISLKKYDNGIALLTLNRPEMANALSVKLLNEMSEQLDTIQFDRSIRCLIITGSGERAFCAGADLKERSAMNEIEVKQTVALIKATIQKVADLPQPTIAAINGSAFGGGLELALACDIRMAADSAKLGLTETSLGIIPGAGGTQRLSRIVGLSLAKELIFTAKRLTAEEAKQFGIVSRIASFDTLKESAEALAEDICKNAPIAVIQAKKALNEGYDTDLKTSLKIEEMCYAITIPTKDRLEGLQAFKEKRPPQYKGE